MSFERKHCIVKSCNRKNTRKFSLPSDTEGAKLWLELLDRKDLENHRNTSNLRVCEAHFAPHMMTASGKRLVQWAIPYKVLETEVVSEEAETQTEKQQQIEIKKIDENNTTISVKPQIININQVTSNEFAKHENHQDATEVLNFEIKDDVKSVIEKATIIKDGNIVGKIDTIDLNKDEVQTVIETLKVDNPQIITINPTTIPAQTIQTITQIQNSNSAATSTSNTTNCLRQTAKTIVVSDQSINNTTTITTTTAAAAVAAAKKRKLIMHNHNKNKIRKSDLINLAHQAINEAKNPPAKDEDQFDLIGKRIAIDLRHMDGRQKAIAEKLVNDVIYYGKIGQLRETSSFNPFYSSAPAPIVSTAPTVIQTAVPSSSHHHHQQQHQHQQHQQQNHQPQHTRQIQTVPAATVTTPVVAAASSSQTITIPPVGSLITATPIVSTVQVAGTNQIIYTVSNQNANASTISINGQAEQPSNTNGNDKCQWWSARNLAYM